MRDFEKLGAFYLGRPVGSAEPLLYDAKDLTTHAVCVGMTGSGKTGLCVALLEEAAIDGIPAIAIDPKGDLANLLLAFPELRPADFRPWIDEGEAGRRGVTPDELAASTAEAWRKGLAEWGQDGARIERYRSSVDAVVYTPGSDAGIPLTILRSFAAPAAALVDDADAFRERVVASVSGLLGLLRIDADPLRSREHVLLSNLLDRSWRAGQDVDLGGLIREIQNPPFERVGVLDVETFYPAKERAALAMALNNLLASPGFGAWLQGEPLDVQRLLFTSDGKPRLSIVSIAHLGEAERMFFVTLLLSEVVAWMRTQPGTPSLRALLYMDEVFGYFPPVANPPSKTPMLTLLKQARAYGLGVVLATQNPVDLDYKGLSNAGTWLLGRLQTERDKARVLEGLEGASAAAGASFDRAKTEATLAGLKNRTFLMNNVHEDAPVLFQSRWALSYLRGPLTRGQIATLMASRKAVVPPPRAKEPAPVTQGRPAVPADANESFLPWRGAAAQATAYRPALLGSARVHFVATKLGLDTWQEVTLLASLGATPSDAPWDGAESLDAAPELERGPREGASFAELPAAASRSNSYAAWGKALADSLYRMRTLAVSTCPELRETSKPEESEGDFRVRLAQRAREERDARVEALRAKYAPKVAALVNRLRMAQERVAREKGQYEQQSLQTVISVGATILGGLFGRKTMSAGTIGRATTAARGIGRSLREHEDVGSAEESAQAVQAQIDDLTKQLDTEIAALQQGADPASLRIETTEVHPRKADVTVVGVRLVWVPSELRGPP